MTTHSPFLGLHLHLPFCLLDPATPVLLLIMRASSCPTFCPPPILSASFVTLKGTGNFPTSPRHHFTLTITVNVKYSSCAKLSVNCKFSETDLPCPLCNILGVPDCTFTDPNFFIENVSHAHNAFLYKECSALCAAVHNNQLPPSSSDHEYTKAQSWFYSTVQGAITCFMLNHYATNGLALHGYCALASSATDTGLLTRFICLGFKIHLHLLVFQVITDHLQMIFLALLGVL
ncbi:hypothetical protein DFH08DRAFT_797412 [Mycena albidolilacea]|uniref:Uncharacterized protein n=1 Tax=Mycena albidolilacea TaxID=1033008 RepID=A0AAD7ARC5_9AGAR|nr:hypothetical protein DFH08DRAFT_797412 [Mycena albidolilacea]